MAGTKEGRLERLTKVVPVERVFLVSWRGERFTKGAGEEITKDEFERLRELLGASVTYLPFNSPDMF